MAQLQNVPSRSKPQEYDERIQELGPRIRGMFEAPPADEFAPEGYDLIIIDESQLELRLGAHFTKDPTLLSVYKRSVEVDGMLFYIGDIHAETSQKMNVPRKLAKNLNFGLCLVSGTTILTIDGYRPIEEIKVGDLVMTRTGWRCVTGLQRLLVNKLVTIKTATGKTVTGTPDHMLERYFPSANGMAGGKGWVEMGRLKRGDYLVYHGRGYSKGSVAPKESCALLGWFLSEGNYSNSRYKISQDPKVNPSVAKKMDEYLGFRWYDLDGSPHISAPKSVFERHLAKFGTEEALNNRIPKSVFSLNRRARLEILGALWDGDGSVSVTRRRAQISYSSKNRNLLEDVVHLLDSVGINSRIYDYDPNLTATVGVVGNSKVRFLKSIPTVKVVGKRYEPKKRFDAEEKIVETFTETVEPTTVHDFTVANDHSFIANGLVSHNCYGMSAVTFAKYAKLYAPGTKTYDVYSAEVYVRAFHNTYAGVFNYHERLRRFWNEGRRSYLMISGRYRHFPKYARVSPGTIYNSKIQGSAADILKVQLWAIDKWILSSEEFAGLRPLIQVHDEFIFEVPKRISQRSAVALKYVMEYPFFPTEVPLLASAKVCQNWSAKDNDAIPEIGTFYARIGGVDRTFTPDQWGQYLAVEKEASQKSCVAMLTSRQREWAKSLLPENIPVFGKRSQGVSIISIDEYRRRKESSE